MTVLTRQRGIHDWVVVNPKRTMKCLWIARDIPFPQDAGDRIYSAQLAASLAAAGAQVRFMGFLDVARAAVPSDWLLDWVAVPGRRRNDKAALLSVLPRVAAVHATRAYRKLLAEQLQEPWDVVVIDGYGSGWALQFLLSHCRRSGVARPHLVYVSHNDETTLWRSMAGTMKGSLLKKLAVRQNFWKVRALEQALINQVDLITAITGSDADAYAGRAPHTPRMVLTPGYSGALRTHRVIGTETPRHVVMVGSFRWLIKHENLRRFVAAADAAFWNHGIELHVIGDITPTLLAALRSQARACHFHGYVDDISGYFDQARMAVVPEQVGGGFKLKFLDYVFNRVPVATITSAAAGLSPVLCDCFLCGDDFEGLVATIIAQMDDVQQLNALQNRAYMAAGSLFDWADRGRDLLDALESLCANGALNQIDANRHEATQYVDDQPDMGQPVSVPLGRMNMNTEASQ